MNNSRLISGILFAILFITALCVRLPAQETIIVRPTEIDDVLTNPGIGFMTFQRFNGDKLNTGKSWTEGKPIVYQEFDGNLENKDHPILIPNLKNTYLMEHLILFIMQQDTYQWPVEKDLDLVYQ